MAILFSSDVLLSVAELQKRLKDRQELRAQIAVLQKQLAETEEWVNLVAKVIGPERASQLIDDAPLLSQVETSDGTTPLKIRQRPGGVTWTGFIEDYVNSTNRPVNYAELREAISKSVLGSKLEKSEKSFFGAIIKLADSGRVIKEDRWIFSVAAFDEYKRKVAIGEVQPLPSSSEQHARKLRVGDVGRRSLKTSASYHPPKAPPNDSSGTEEETVISSESSEARLIPPAGDDAEPRSTEVGKDQYASGGGPMTPRVYVGTESAGVPFEVPPNNSRNPPAPVEAQPKTQTPQMDFGRPLELPPPTKSLFPADQAAATPEPSPAVKSLFEALSAAPRDLP
ncbi:MAG: hypothetical protein E5X48_25220 [Mesorhizobium sp.]|uniref:hypothetical protein n=1 Tax=Mesorhizobium sp. TaxID=1871066 RepID=UPI0011F4086E|nr:hypothetical protein [Mesorhizobium sp.]TIQ33110.1 MAG: hypothetical protein E5X48_25220 [Mesorhizobium sp.]